MKIKVCGMRNRANIMEIAALGPDYLGFIFYPGSKRYAGQLPQDISGALPGNIIKTGVFADADFEEIVDKIISYRLGAVQLHGQEPAGLCSILKNEGIQVIKAFGIGPDFDFGALKPYYNAVDFFLFDTSTPGYGGSGITFDWGLLQNYMYDLPYFLSGGIGPDTISRVTGLNDPRLYAVDLNSRFELEPGMKDPEKLKIAFEQIKTAFAGKQGQEDL